MAVGFPTKANWAAGDVLTASAQDDLAATVNLLSNASAASGSQLISNVAGTSFAYQATPSASNPVLNSAFTVWQRGTSSGTTGVYGADRWYQGRGTATATWSQVTTGLPTGFQYGMKVQRTAGQTNTDSIYVMQPMETVNSIPFAGKTITFSFYAKAGANLSSTSSTMPIRLFTGTGTDQSAASAIGGWTGYAEPIASSPTLTTSWQRFSYSATLGSTVSQIGFLFYLFPVGTAGADDSFSVTGVQIDIGSVALPFRTYAATYQNELAACQRYYWRSTATGSYSWFGQGFGISASNILYPITNPVAMRTAAASIETSNVVSYDGGVTGAGTITIQANECSTLITRISYAGSGFTAYRPYGLLANNNTAAYVGASAEL